MDVDIFRSDRLAYMSSIEWVLLTATAAAIVFIGNRLKMICSVWGTERNITRKFTYQKSPGGEGLR